MKFIFILNILLVLVCFYHISTILFNALIPDKTSVKYYKKRLEDIEFPLLIKYCLHLENETDIFNSFGYKDIWRFYYGMSLYDEKQFGWSGHSSENGTLFGSPRGTYLHIQYCL